jgi:cell wall-associated NlpC family hydrolase
MKSQHNSRSETDRQDSNAPEATKTQPMIQQQPTDSSTTKELRSHQCIAIKWSFDSASQRRIGSPPAAAGSVALRMAEAGCGSC